MLDSGAVWARYAYTLAAHGTRFDRVSHTLVNRIAAKPHSSDAWMLGARANYDETILLYGAITLHQGSMPLRTLTYP